MPAKATLAATEVFTPGSFPTHTYVQRADATIEQHLRDALDTKGHIVSLVGPSKSGKTVLVEKVVGRDNLLVITGAGITSAADVWERFLDAAEAPTTRAAERSRQSGVSAELSAEGGTSVWGLIAAKFGMKGKADASRGAKEGSSFGRRGLEDIVDLFAETPITLLIDDFHYMGRDSQLDVTKALKEAARRGVSFVVATVGHRADDIGRVNPEMRGRVELVELDYWDTDELSQIAALGFDALNSDLSSDNRLLFVREAAGSPQLMQLICLNASREVGVRQRSKSRIAIDLGSVHITEVFRRCALAADFRSHVEVLEDGPRVRGTDRKHYKSTKGWQGDVYSVVLSALALDPPQLSFSYQELVARASAACNGESPSGASIAVCCEQLNKLLLRKFPVDRVLDWDVQKQILSIPDPHFLFYLRWSGKLDGDDPTDDDAN